MKTKRYKRYKFTGVIDRFGDLLNHDSKKLIILYDLRRNGFEELQYKQEYTFEIVLKNSFPKYTTYVSGWKRLNNIQKIYVMGYERQVPKLTESLVW